MTETPIPQRITHRVLVVDDDYDLAELLREVLTYENCDVQTASNGVEAMNCLYAGDYALVLCDLMMPRMDGQALYDNVVREFPHLAECFVFITGQASNKNGFIDFVERTGNRLLEKPFDMQELRRVVCEILPR